MDVMEATSCDFGSGQSPVIEHGRGGLLASKVSCDAFFCFVVDNVDPDLILQYLQCKPFGVNLGST